MADAPKPFVWAQKDPTERYEYEHDWANRLLVNDVDVGDTIRPSNDPDPQKRPKIEVVEGAVVVDAIVLQGTKIQYWLSGGTVGKARLVGTITTTQDRVYQESFILPIKER